MYESHGSTILTLITEILALVADEEQPKLLEESGEEMSILLLNDMEAEDIEQKADLEPDTQNIGSDLDGYLILICFLYRLFSCSLAFFFLIRVTSSVTVQGMKSCTIPL